MCRQCVPGPPFRPQAGDEAKKKIEKLKCEVGMAGKKIHRQ